MESGNLRGMKSPYGRPNESLNTSTTFIRRQLLQTQAFSMCICGQFLILLNLVLRLCLHMVLNIRYMTSHACRTYACIFHLNFVVCPT